MNHIAYIGIGSNIDDKLDNCNAALLKINKLGATKILEASEWYRNKALTSDPAEIQSDYINGVIKIETSLNPKKLLTALKEIEKSFGRELGGRKWAPRVIDLDILIYGDRVIETDELKIPHPELHKRTFVLQPLCDIEPGLIHPVFKVTMEELLKKL